jgi:hypothetical protein
LFSTPQYDDATDDLKYVINIVSDQDAGVTRIARTSNKAQHSLCFFNAQIVCRLVQNNQFTGEIHRPCDRNRLAFAAR